MTAAQFRSSPAWKRARERALRGAEHCELCGGMLVPGAPPRSRWASSVDHVVALARLDLSTPEGRKLALDPANLKAVHLGCNSRRGDGRRRAQSEGWLGPQRPGLEEPPHEHSVPQVWSIAEAVERLQAARDDDLEFAGIDEPLEA